MKYYIRVVLLPYVQAKRKELKVAADHCALVIFNNFTGQCTEDVLALLEDNHINVVMVPANCTDRLQLLDISVDMAARNFLRGQFQDWYATQVCQQLKDDMEIQPTDLCLSIVKPLGARWMQQLYDYLKSKPQIICNGFKSAGITDSLSS